MMAADCIGQFMSIGGTCRRGNRWSEPSAAGHDTRRESRFPPDCESCAPSGEYEAGTFVLTSSRALPCRTRRIPRPAFRRFGIGFLIDMYGRPGRLFGACFFWSRWGRAGEWGGFVPRR